MKREPEQLGRSAPLWALYLLYAALIVLIIIITLLLLKPSTVPTLPLPTLTPR